MSEQDSIGVIAALGSALSWSMGAILFERLGQSLSSFSMTLLKGVVSVALLAVPAAMIGGIGDTDPHAVALLAASGVLGIAFADTFFFMALKSLGSQGIVLLSTVGQVFTIFLAVALLGERMSTRAYAAVGLILVGVTIGLLPRAQDAKRSSTKGLVFGVLSMLCMSLSVIMTKRGVASVSTIHATLIRMLAGSAGMFVTGALSGRLGEWINPFKSRGLAVRFVLAVVVITFGGFWLAVVAFKFTNVAVASSLLATEPLFVLPLSALLLKAHVGWRAIAGAMVATLGAITLCTGGAGL